MANNSNLKPWKPGQSGNPAGKPVGAKNLSTWIRELLNNPDFELKIQSGTQELPLFNGPPVQAILEAAILRAIAGDTKSADLLFKYRYANKTDIKNNTNIAVSPILGGITKRPAVEVIDVLDLE